MPYAPLPMAPGPVTVPTHVRDALAQDYGPGQSEPDFMALYHATGRSLAHIMGTRNDVVLMTGEAMLALWAGLKSCLQPGNRVLCIVTGVFGDGIGDMAASFGCEVCKVSYPYNETLHSLERIDSAVVSFKPHMITAVHCDTPSGTLNPLQGLAEIKRHRNVPLLYVDAVASVGGAPVCMDAWGIDILLGGTQKCLAAPPNMCFLGVSDTAWERVVQVAYQGYDALLPWRTVRAVGRCPYTPYWHGLAALHAATQSLLAEGLDVVYSRHEAVARLCRAGLTDLGIPLWCAPDAVPAPMVTAAHVPAGWTWTEWRAALRQRGLVVAGSFGPMADRVFRLGHMGSQAHEALMLQALAVIQEVFWERLTI